jgi:hypothetical protein
MARALSALIVLSVMAAACMPGASPVVTSSSTPPISSGSSGPSPPPRWAGTIVSRSTHRLYVGGTCSSDWRTRVRFLIRGTEVHGSALASLTSRGDPCPFPVAQLEIRRFTLAVSGTFENGRLRIRLREDDHVPSAGADDLGGFRMTTLGTDLHLRVRHRRVSTTFTLRAPDQDRGEFASTNVVRLRCVSC